MGSRHSLDPYLEGYLGCASTVMTPNASSPSTSSFLAHALLETILATSMLQLCALRTWGFIDRSKTTKRHSKTLSMSKGSPLITPTTNIMALLTSCKSSNISPTRRLRTRKLSFLRITFSSSVWGMLTSCKGSHLAAITSRNFSGTHTNTCSSMLLMSSSSVRSSNLKRIQGLRSVSCHSHPTFLSCKTLRVSPSSLTCLTSRMSLRCSWVTT